MNNDFELQTYAKWKKDEAIIKAFMSEHALELYDLLYFFTANNDRVEEVRALVDKLKRRLDPTLYRDEEQEQDQ